MNAEMVRPQTLTVDIEIDSAEVIRPFVERLYPVVTLNLAGLFRPGDSERAKWEGKIGVYVDGDDEELEGPYGPFVSLEDELIGLAFDHVGDGQTYEQALCMIADRLTEMAERIRSHQPIS